MAGGRGQVQPPATERHSDPRQRLRACVTRIDYDGMDDYMHDLQVERFYVGRPEGPIKTFPLRGIKDSPPYLHDGRCPTLADVVEFFNIILELKLTPEEKEDLVAYLLCL